MDKSNIFDGAVDKKRETFEYQAENLLSQTYRIFIPDGCELNSDTKVLVCIHGISRQYKKQIRLLRADAIKNNTILIAPYFNALHHPSFQRHEVGVDEFRSDEVLNNMITDVEQRFHFQIEKFDLFGFSGGSQFAHRYAFRYPEKVSKLICCAAGWYTFPDLNLAFPYGLAQNDETFILDNVENKLSGFLKIPLTIAVGEHDKHQKQPSLNHAKKINMQQGFNRIERANRWTMALVEQSNRLGIEPQLRFILLPKSGHSFTECVKYGKLSDYIF